MNYTALHLTELHINTLNWGSQYYTVINYTEQYYTELSYC